MIEEKNKKLIIIISSIILILGLVLIVVKCSNSNKYIYTKKSKNDSKLPYVKIKDPEFDKINQQLEKQYNEVVNSKYKSSFTYKYNVKNNIFSLLIIQKIRGKDSDFVKEIYNTYNYDLKKHVFLNQDEVLSRFNISKNYLEEKIENELKSQYKFETIYDYLEPRECDYKCFLSDKEYKSVEDNVVIFIDNKLYGYLNVNNGSLYYSKDDYPKTKKIYKLD